MFPKGVCILINVNAELCGQCTGPLNLNIDLNKEMMNEEKKSMWSN